MDMSSMDRSYGVDGDAASSSSRSHHAASASEYNDREDSFLSTQNTESNSKPGRRTHARRSCLACRQRKARCELPDLTVPSSHDPLPTDLKCHRCKTLKTDCVVWDGDRKARQGKAPRYGPPVSDTVAAIAATRANGGSSPSFSSPSRNAVSDHHAKNAYKRRPSHSSSPAPDRTGAASGRSEYPRKWQRGAEQTKRARPLGDEDSGLATASVVADSLLVWEDRPESKGMKETNSLTPDAGSNTHRSTLLLGPGKDISQASLSGVTSTAQQSKSSQFPSDKTQAGLTTDAPAQAPGSNIRSLQYRKKLAAAIDRNGAQVCEILYKSPQYPARAKSFASCAQGLISDTPDASLDEGRLRDFMLANPFIDPRIVNASADPTSAATTYLRHVVAYLCDRDKNFSLIGHLIQRTACHLIFQTRSRDVCAGLLLMATYEPVDLMLPRPGDDLDETIDHAPGNCLYHVATTIAVSLDMPKSIARMSTGPTALSASTPVQERLDRLREAALWLSISNFGVLCAWSNVEPNLPAPAPTLAEIDAFESHLQPIFQNAATSHLAAPLTALALRSKFFHRIKSFWAEVRLLDVKNLANLGPMTQHVEQLIGDVDKIEEAQNSEMRRLDPSPAMSLVLQYQHIERLDSVITLCARISVAFGSAAVQKIDPAATGVIRPSLYQSMHAATAETRQNMHKVRTVVLDRAEELLVSVGRLVPPQSSIQHAFSRKHRTTPPTSSIPPSLLFVSPIALSCAIFGAGKLVVAFSACLNFGYGKIHPRAEHQLAGMRDAIEVLDCFSQERPLSIPAIMANIMRELARRYDTMVSAGNTATVEWDRSLPQYAPSRFRPNGVQVSHLSTLTSASGNDKGPGTQNRGTASNATSSAGSGSGRSALYGAMDRFSPSSASWTRRHDGVSPTPTSVHGAMSSDVNIGKKSPIATELSQHHVEGQSSRTNGRLSPPQGTFQPHSKVGQDGVGSFRSSASPGHPWQTAGLPTRSDLPNVTGYTPSESTRSSMSQQWRQAPPGEHSRPLAPNQQRDNNTTYPAASFANPETSWSGTMTMRPHESLSTEPYRHLPPHLQAGVAPVQQEDGVESYGVDGANRARGMGHIVGSLPAHGFQLQPHDVSQQFPRHLHGPQGALDVAGRDSGNSRVTSHLGQAPFSTLTQEGDPNSLNRTRMSPQSAASAVMADFAFGPENPFHQEMDGWVGFDLTVLLQGTDAANPPTSSQQMPYVTATDSASVGPAAAPIHPQHQLPPDRQIYPNFSAPLSHSSRQDNGGQIHQGSAW